MINISIVLMLSIIIFRIISILLAGAINWDDVLIILLCISSILDHIQIEKIKKGELI